MGILAAHADADWPDHAYKRVRLTLAQELVLKGDERQQTLFNRGNGNLTDVTVYCGARSWRAHSAMLASNCQFFQACLGGKFKESQSKVVHLDDDNADAVEDLLEFLYTLSAQTVDRALANNGGKNVTEYLIALIKLADKYDQPLLLEQIYETFSRDIFGKLKSTDMIKVLASVGPDMGTSIWIKRIEESILTSLTSGLALDKIGSEASKILQDNPSTVKVLLQTMSQKIHKLSDRVHDMEDVTQNSDDELYSDPYDNCAAMNEKFKSHDVDRQRRIRMAKD